MREGEANNNSAGWILTLVDHRGQQIKFLRLVVLAYVFFFEYHVFGKTPAPISPNHRHRQFRPGLVHNLVRPVLLAILSGHVGGL